MDYTRAFPSPVVTGQRDLVKLLLVMVSTQDSFCIALFSSIFLKNSSELFMCIRLREGKRQCSTLPGLGWLSCRSNYHRQLPIFFPAAWSKFLKDPYHSLEDNSGGAI